MRTTARRPGDPMSENRQLGDQDEDAFLDRAGPLPALHVRRQILTEGRTGVVWAASPWLTTTMISMEGRA